MVATMQAEQVLQQYWGYPAFRPGQSEIIDAILHHHSVLAIMPTGGGKSICFQVPALMLPGLTLVVSPLISLMKDQVDALMRRGVAAAHLSSAQSAQEQSDVFSQLQQGQLKLLYLSPERLHSRRFLATIKTIPVSLLVIDEAHCISEWGHNFRPEFRQIPFLLKHLTTKPKVAAFTATATPSVQADIIASLHLDNPATFVSSFERDNLAIEVNYCPSVFSQQLTLLRLIKQHRSESGIVYVSSRASAHALAKLITTFYPTSACGFYHAGLSAEERTAVQESFLTDQLKVIVATNAFGMGIDKSSIRYVVHYQIPASLEHYYQEIGRAGRDRQPSTTTLLYNPYNLQIHLKLINKSAGQNRAYMQHQVKKLDAMRQFARATECRSRVILRYFGETTAQNCGRCDNCRHIQYTHPMLNQIELSERNQLRSLFDARRLLAKHWSVQPVDVAHPHVLCQMALVDRVDETSIRTLAGVGDGWLKTWWPQFKQAIAD